jgi:hypothetical protein
VSILEIVKSPPERIMGYVVIWAILGSDDAMTASRPDLRLPAIVFATMLGMLSAGAEAAGCSAKGPGDDRAARSCCSARSGPACCCGAEESRPRPRSSERGEVDIAKRESRLLAPVSPCECRAGDPTDQAAKPGSSSPRLRRDHDGPQSAERVLDARPAIAIARLVLTTESPPGTPLYLRTSHLLF